MPAAMKFTPDPEVPVDSLALALAQLRGAGDVSPKQQEQFAGAVRSLCKLVGREPEAIPASVSAIQQMPEACPGPAPSPR